MAAAADPGPGIPWRAMRWCLERGGVQGRHLTGVALAHKPYMAADRILSAALAFAPGGSIRFVREAENRLGDAALGVRLRSAPLLYVERPEALAAAAFAGSGFERAAILVAGCEGEWADTVIARADGRALDLLSQLDYPHGLWPLCEAAASAAGVESSRLPSLAAKGDPKTAAMLVRDLADIKADGSLRLDTGYVVSCASLVPASRRLSRLLAGQKPEDVAAALQGLAIETLGRSAAQARRETGCDDLCLTGPFARWPAVVDALRGEATGRVFAASGYAADAAVGAAIAAWHRTVQRERVVLDDAGLVHALPAKPRNFAAATTSAAARFGLRLVYYLGLTPYSLLLRLLGAEFIDERWSARGSYWKLRPKEGEGLVLGLRRRF